MALSPEKIEKYRNIIATSSSDLAVKTAKDKLKDAGISEKAEEPKKEPVPKGSLSNKEVAKKYNLTDADVEKLRKILRESTNETAIKGAAEKLKAAGIDEKEKQKIIEAAVESKKKHDSSKKDRSAHSSYANFEARVADIMHKKHKTAMAKGNDLTDKHMKTVLHEGFKEKWSAIFTAKQLVKLMKKKSDSAKPDDEFDCDTLIAQAKERKKKSEEAKKKRASQPKKTPATKNKEAIKKTSDRILISIEKRAKTGKVSVAEVEKQIAAYEEGLSKLKALLKKLKSGAKFEGGGNVTVGNGWRHKRSFLPNRN